MNTTIRRKTASSVVMNTNTALIAKSMWNFRVATIANLITLNPANVRTNMINVWQDFYDDLLNEMGEVEIGTLKFLPSDILKKCDPVAYDQGLLDFEDYMRENAEINK